MGGLELDLQDEQHWDASMVAKAREEIPEGSFTPESKVVILRKTIRNIVFLAIMKLTPLHHCLVLCRPDGRDC
eukprot:scaffold4184_cov393-Alexandrium_tamarense.AAC.4